MYLKHFLSIIFLFLLPNSFGEDLDDLSDFAFLSSAEDDSSNPSNPPSEDYENDVTVSTDLEDDDQIPSAGLSINLAAKESQVRQVIANSMKTREMKDNMAKVLPILRAMSPEQKLALATIVTSQVLAPQSSRGLSLQEVSALFGNNPNITSSLMLPISLDIANLFRRSARSEKGPTAEELRAPPHLIRGPGLYRRNTIERPLHNKIYRRKPLKIQEKDGGNCELFTSSICLKSHDYPIEAILSSIRRNKYAMNALLTDVKSPLNLGDGSPPESELNPSFNDSDLNEVRRAGGESGYMCPSIVRYARPQKARATSGQWKYIVNTPDHTQTLRLERCMKAGDTCTYLTDNFKSRCVQVYNYHRLLTWDSSNGLHMDIFKVPTCCSCHIDSYKVPFPPHLSNHAVTSENFPGEDLDHEISTTDTVDKQNHYRNDIPYDYHETDASKPRPQFESLPKYLEAPKPQQAFKNEFSETFKRLNTPKPFAKRQRPIRRRVPSKPVRDLQLSESNLGTSTEIPSTSTLQSNTKKINYNYHPIIDFFKPEQIESRMDSFPENDWKPVTSMLLATERSFKR